MNADSAPLGASLSFLARLAFGLAAPSDAGFSFFSRGLAGFLAGFSAAAGAFLPGASFCSSIQPFNVLLHLDGCDQWTLCYERGT